MNETNCGTSRTYVALLQYSQMVVTHHAARGASVSYPRAQRWSGTREKICLQERSFSVSVHSTLRAYPRLHD